MTRMPATIVSPKPVTNAASDSHGAHPARPVARARRRPRRGGRSLRPRPGLGLRSRRRRPELGRWRQVGQGREQVTRRAPRAPRSDAMTATPAGTPRGAPGAREEHGAHARGARARDVELERVADVQRVRGRGPRRRRARARARKIAAAGLRAPASAELTAPSTSPARPVAPASRAATRPSRTRRRAGGPRPAGRRARRRDVVERPEAQRAEQRRDAARRVPARRGRRRAGRAPLAGRLCSARAAAPATRDRRRVVVRAVERDLLGERPRRRELADRDAARAQLHRQQRRRGRSSSTSVPCASSVTQATQCHVAKIAL